MKNTITLDFRDNPDLKAALAGKQPGEKCNLEFEVTVRSVDDETFEADIDAIYYENQETETQEKVEPDVDSPVMVVMVKERADAPSGKAPAKPKEDGYEK